MPQKMIKVSRCPSVRLDIANTEATVMITPLLLVEDIVDDQMGYRSRALLKCPLPTLYGKPEPVYNQGL